MRRDDGRGRVAIGCRQARGPESGWVVILTDRTSSSVPVQAGLDTAAGARFAPAAEVAKFKGKAREIYAAY